MTSMRRRLLVMLALILFVTQLTSVFWLWHESQEQINLLVNDTLSAKVRNAHVEKEIAEAIASLIAPSLTMLAVTLLLCFWAINWIIRPLKQLQHRLETRSADNLTPLPLNTEIQEVFSVTIALNQLLARLSQTIAQERLFTADAAHELRTPLAGLRLHLELMERKGVDGSSMLIGRIDQLMHTVEQLLMLSRAGQNFAEGQYQKVNLVIDVIAPLREELEELLAGHRQRLIVKHSEHAEVEGDAVLLRLMLRNVVENAYRYGPQDSDITITLSESDQGVLAQVDDCGPGIEEKRVGELTQAYKRADQRFGGSGLGLNIVLRILNMHGGSLRLVNRKDRSGLSAQCWLPRQAFTQNSATSLSE
ncbi:two-component system sensor histidine kinase PmrB [Rouxiella badensis]|jgi:two-component system sensor histidine kinase BasS|uniref:histidine kinase n=1 Tax=Rouxiella badensis TaxID=1646377 RepID=A0A1X0WBA6_9GAMM|nr:two-component system sensor histidine kinase PmrB [Rouxiella badensis]MCC3704894.1 two-component system sensor histidine kinase PmrB [Rouxiella badensis]MCC3719552.1 two-component system sensor histidine kinase PmrB [Rouxiella badensis]MCC3728802.1 two-component system sensor histidine kinase PmrB [Rouxiella badensis]MCC3733227.1 two-component system sensor histidine kinase PmrB [Rouxiella badensis]MCC3741002.1 two-component system sensor histidine kinase PmrB [Rouxiella badensis]